MVELALTNVGINQIGILKGRKNKLFLVILLVLCLFLLVGSSLVLAYALGGGMSEKLISMNGVADSQLVIGRSGVADSQLDIATGINLTTLSPLLEPSRSTLRGTVDDLRGFPSASVWFEWGYDTSYGNIVGTETAVVTGLHSFTLTGVQPGETIYYRFGANTDGTIYGIGYSFEVMGTPVFNLMYYVVPIILVALLIFLLLGLLGSGMSLIQVVVIGAVLIYIGMSFLDSIVVALQALW